jgi:hypothetical protein
MIKCSSSWVWWCISLIPPFRRTRQEGHEIKTNLGYIVKSYSEEGGGGGGRGRARKEGKRRR